MFWLEFVGFHYWHDEQPIYVNLSSVLLNYDSKLPAVILTLVTLTVNCSLHHLSKCLKFPQNNLPTRTDRLDCLPSWMKLCTVRVTWRTCSTSETALLFCPLKFAGFHNHSPLLTMYRQMSFLTQKPPLWIVPFIWEMPINAFKLEVAIKNGLNDHG